MAGALVEATQETFRKELAAQNVLVDFWAEWCAPCKRLIPVLEDVAAAVSPKVKFLKINVDTTPEVAETYQVMSIPTLVFIKNGQEVDRIVGAVPKETLIDKLRTVFSL